LGYRGRMRTILGTCAVVGTLFAIPLACGGSQTGSDSSKVPPGVTGAPTDTSGAGAAGSGAPTTTTTTTTTLGDGGDLQGAKLQQTTTVASTTGSTAPASSGHTHDPGRSAADIRAIVMARRDDARACYDKGLKDHPGIEGDLTIQWTIDPKGNVSAISQDTSRSQITEPGVVACIVKIIQAIQFAASPGGFETKAYYPFNFHPRHAN
jgi:hypothetical protein